MGRNRSLSACPFAKGASGCRPLTRWAWGTPRSARRSRVTPSIKKARARQVPKAPLLFFSRSFPPLLRASVVGVAFGLPLASNRLRGSLRLCTRLPRPHAVPPSPSLFPASAPRRGAFAETPFGSFGSVVAVSRPPAERERGDCTTAVVLWCPSSLAKMLRERRAPF